MAMLPDLALRVATWNIGGGFTRGCDGDFDTEDTEYFISELQRHVIDIICIQEAHIPTQRHLPSQAQILGSALGLPFLTEHPIDTINQSHIKNNNLLSLAILSKYEIIKSSYIQLPNPQLNIVTPRGVVWISHDKGILVSTVNFHGFHIDILTIHNVPFIHFGRDFMEQEFMYIRSTIEDIMLLSLDRPTILAGDMNYQVVEQLLPRVFTGGYYKALCGVITEPVRKRHIDHILVTKHWNTVRGVSIPGKADHYLCYVDLLLK
jgi:endonuclease/exonuclease/phosphatase family metal-dependent hydrolase